ncbi:MAG: DUF3857 domain-containing protein [Chloroherpetonaceae bacterium]|nr:DUF3857 domain-containing protein [Chloroherpetonaceae bacterium]
MNNTKNYQIKFLFWLISGFFYCESLHSQTFIDGKVYQHKKPFWVKDIEFSKEDLSNYKSETIYLLRDVQVNVETEEEYFHYASKVNKQTALKDNAQISFSFSESYQTLIIHNIDVYRNGKKINKYNKKKIEIFRREQNLSDNIYDGEKTASAVLEDIQVGDILDYSFTIKGRNPIFKGKYSDSYPLTFSRFLIKNYLRILYDKNRAIKYEIKNAEQYKETVSLNGNLFEKEWIGVNIPQIEEEENTPDWFTPYGNIYFSEFSSWSDVLDWATGIYRIPYSNTNLVKKVNEIKQKFNAPEKQILEVIRFVQDDIRYLGIEIGENSHKPQEPEKTITNRYGDCKDKSLLLVELLNLLGHKAYPAFVNTYNGIKLNEYLPSSTLFNHAICLLEFDGSKYWIDATMTLQRGALWNRENPPYGYALVLGDSSKGLTFINDNGSRGTKVVVTENWSLNENNPDKLNLAVNTQFFGQNARNTRRYFQSFEKSEIKKEYEAFYERYYEGVELIDEVEITDNEEDNIITVNEVYLVDKESVFNDAENEDIAQIAASSLISYIPKIHSGKRKMPFRLEYPSKIIYSININFPVYYFINNSIKINSPHILFNQSVNFYGNKMNIFYEFHTKSDFVQPESFLEFRRDVEKINNVTSYKFQRNIKFSDSTQDGLNRFQEFLMFALIFIFPLSALSLIFYLIREKNDLKPDQYHIEFIKNKNGINDLRKATELYYNSKSISTPLLLLLILSLLAIGLNFINYIAYLIVGLGDESVQSIQNKFNRGSIDFQVISIMIIALLRLAVCFFSLFVIYFFLVRHRFTKYIYYIFWSLVLSTSVLTILMLNFSVEFDKIDKGNVQNFLFVELFLCFISILLILYSNKFSQIIFFSESHNRNLV